MSRVLLVEDSKVQALVAKRVLEGAGYTVEHVTTAEEALRACYDTPPDIVLQDQHLAELSGLEVCRRIKSDFALASIPVLVLTAGNKERDHIAALDAGADAFLPKDSPSEELLAVIARQIETAANTKPIDAGEISKVRSKPSRILAIDDSPTFLKVLCRRLTEAGFDVVAASSAAEGLALLGELPFDVAVVDVVMPELNGFEFCTRARQRAIESNAHLGLLVLTGSNREDVLLEALDAGADDYVTKQQDMGVILAHATALARRIARAKQIAALNARTLKQGAAEAASKAKSEFLTTISREIRTPIDEMLRMMERLMDTKLSDDQRECLNDLKQSADLLLRLLNGHLDNRALDELTPQGGPTETAPPEKQIDKVPAAAITSIGDGPQSEPVREPADGLFSFDVAMQRIPGGIDGVKEMTTLLLSECSKQLEEIRAGLDEQDAKRVQRGAHTIKGSGDVFAANRVVKAARHLEQIGRNGDLTSAPSALQELEAEVGRLREAIVAHVERLA